MPKFRLKNSVDCDEERIVNLIKGTNGDRFLAGWKGHGNEKFKANDTALIFEVMCENKPYGDVGVTWEEDVPTDTKEVA